MKVVDFVVINEEFDEPVAFNRLSTGKYMFNIGDNMTYLCSFEDTANKAKELNKILRIKLRPGAKIKNFSFTGHINGQTKGLQSLTGTGNVKKVFSTLIEILKDYISKQKPDYLMFFGDDDHYKFYRFIITNIHNYTNDYRVILTERPNPTNPGIIIIERKGAVNENFEIYGNPPEFVKDKNLPIFSFPLSSSEIKELIEANGDDQDFRIIVDGEKKKVYIFPARLFHASADEILGINKYDSYRPPPSDMIYGYAEYFKSKGKFFSYSLRNRHGPAWDFAKKFFMENGK